MTDTNDIQDNTQVADRITGETDGQSFPPNGEAGNYRDIQNPSADAPKPRTTDDVDKPYAE